MTTFGEAFNAISIQPEVLYNSVGAKAEGDGEDISYVVDYISIPVMLQYNVNENFNIQAGPQLGLLLSAKAKADGTLINVSVVVTNFA